MSVGREVWREDLCDTLEKREGWGVGCRWAAKKTGDEAGGVDLEEWWRSAVRLPASLARVQNSDLLSGVSAATLGVN